MGGLSSIRFKYVKYALIALGIVLILLFIQLFIFKRVGEHASKNYVKKAAADDGKSYYERMTQSLKDSGFTCENYKEKCRSKVALVHGEEKDVVIESCKKQIEASLNCA